MLNAACRHVIVSFMLDKEHEIITFNTDRQTSLY